MEGKAVEVAFHFNTIHFRSFNPLSSLYWNKSNLRKKYKHGKYDQKNFTTFLCALMGPGPHMLAVAIEFMRFSHSFFMHA